jgi:hypothetical protein
MSLLHFPSVATGPALAQNIAGFLSGYGLVAPGAGVDEVVAVLRQPSAVFQAAVQSSEGLAHATLHFRDSLYGLGVTWQVRRARAKLPLTSKEKPQTYEYYWNEAARHAADAMVRGGLTVLSDKEERRLKTLLDNIDRYASLMPKKKALTHLRDLSGYLRPDSRRMDFGEHGEQVWLKLFAALSTFADVPWRGDLFFRLSENLRYSSLGGEAAERVLLAFDRLMQAFPGRSRAHDLGLLAFIAGHLDLPDMAESALQAAFDEIGDSRPIPGRIFSEAIAAIGVTERMVRLYRTLCSHLHRRTLHPQFFNMLEGVACRVSRAVLGDHTREIFRRLVESACAIPIVEKPQRRSKTLRLLINTLIDKGDLDTEATPMLDGLFNEAIVSAQLIPDLIKRDNELQWLLSDLRRLKDCGRGDFLERFRSKIYKAALAESPAAGISPKNPETVTAYDLKAEIVCARRIRNRISRLAAFDAVIKRVVSSSLREEALPVLEAVLTAIKQRRPHHWDRDDQRYVVDIIVQATGRVPLGSWTSSFLTSLIKTFGAPRWEALNKIPERGLGKEVLKLYSLIGCQPDYRIDPDAILRWYWPDSLSYSTK